MAVYTPLSRPELERFLDEYDLGGLVFFAGIEQGVENSNFDLRTERGRFILTLYEKRVRRADLPFFLNLIRHLSRAGIHCPTPVTGRDGEVLRELKGRPAAIVSFLDGDWTPEPGPDHCRQLGRALARLHLAGADFEMRRDNDLSITGWPPLLQACGRRADEVEAGLHDELAAELAWLETRWPDDLPVGVIHADLFPDNVFFSGSDLSGMIDFYFACTDMLSYDLAICLNAWCFDDTGGYLASLGSELIAGYRAVRQLSEAEWAALPILARGSALRFTLTRLYDWLNHPEGALVRPKDPLDYLRRLRFHQGVADPRAYEENQAP